MKSNLQSFLLGCLIGLLPVSLYGYIKLNNNTINTKYYFDYENYSYISTENITKSLLNQEISSKQISETQTVDKPQVKTNLSKVGAESLEVKRQTAPKNVRVMIDRYSREYGANTEMMVLIAKCESGFREEAINGSFGGIYQFLSSTWQSNRRAMGLDPNPDLRYNAEESIKTAAFKMGRDGYGAWPACSQKAYKTLGLALN